MRVMDIGVSLGVHALAVATLLLWAQPGPVSGPRTFTVGMVELVGPRTVEPAPAAPTMPPSAASPPAPLTPAVSPPPSPLPSREPAAEARPAPVEKKAIGPKKRSARPPRTPRIPAPGATRPESAPPVPAPAAPGSADSPGAAAGTGATAPSRFIGGMGVYDAEAVEVPPRVVRRELPQYPPSARRLRLEGTVMVSMVIDAQGKPRHCTIREAQPKGVFEESALAAANGFRFVPGKVGGKDVATRVIVPFHFKMSN